MKRTVPALLVVFLFAASSLSGCKKLIEQVKENALMNLITNNLWLVTLYKEDTNDLTAGFAPYEFKFNSNGTVYGRSAGNPDAPGTWVPNTQDITITSAFPYGPAPLHKLTGTWKVTRTTETTVQSYRIENGKTFYLNLKAK